MGTYAKFVSDYCKTWEKSGKEQFVKYVTQTIKDEDKSPLFSKSGKLSGLSQNLYDLMLCGLRGALKKDGVLAVLRDICVLHADIPSIVLDVVCVLDAETCIDVQSEERSNFCYIVRELESFMSDKLLKERLEIDTLQDVGTLKNKNFYTKFIKIKTKLYYKQRKFNLFREESEGYAKLIVELNQEISEDTEWKTILEIMQSLIGCFNLDPNRVLDIILESFEARPHLDKLFIPLIKNYMGDPHVISEVLGFKLSNMEVLDSYKEPPPLMTVIALLLQHQVIALDDIYPWLRPDDMIMAKEAEKDLKAAQDYIRKLNIVSTKGPQANGPTEFIEEKADPQEYWSNQKLVLGEALLRVNAWREFAALSARLPTTLMAPRPAVALCSMLHALVEPLYRTHCRVAPKIIGKPIPPLKSPLAPQSCNTFDDLKETVIPALILLGPSLHHDPILMYKVIRILRTSRSRSEDPLHHEALTVLDAAILPALTLMDGNCCMAEEVYTLLKLYPYQCRYCLYSRWKNEAGERIPALMRVRGNSLQRIKHIMKRVSKENIKPQGRHIGKLSHAAPAFLFDYMLLQIQTYDNLIGPVVESLKYLTSLSLDVLGYCLLEALCTGRGSVAGAAHPPWLQALAAFAGAAFKKHNIELTALLQFVANRLKAQQSQDLLILKEIVQKMAGIEAVEEMTPEQLDAMAGGELLKGEAGYFSQVRNTRRSSARLKESIVGNNLDISLCILAAQQRHCCVWKECEEEKGEPPGSQLKVVGRLADQCQDALVQLGTFLASSHAPDEYAARLPPLQELLRDYHVDADVAFFLHRPVLTQKIAAKAEALRKGIDSKSDNLEKSIERYTSASKETLEPVLISVTPMLPPRVWEDISPEFYVTFWSLSMYDLRVPVESYEREIERLKTAASNVAKDTSQGTKGKKEVERFNTLIEKLQEERRRQEDHVSRVSARLQRECSGWFPARAAKSAKNETVTRLMQLCLFPRCVFTAADALYCAEFVHTVHSLKTPNFSTLLCYDRLFCDITYSVMSCTEGEAARYGTFLCKVLGTAMRWHGDKAAFHRECAHYPGFVTKYRVSNQFTEANDHVGYENYRHVCHKWHYKITKAMVVCLDSGDYVQIRNALIVLIRVLPHFPVLEKLAQIIERKVDKVKEEEKTQRPDLYVLATGYSGQLRNKVPNMMRESDFHQVGDKHKVATAAAAAPAPPKEEPPALKQEQESASPQQPPETEKRESRSNDRRKDEVDREKEIKRESRVTLKERTKEEVRSKERSPRERPHREERYLETVSPPHDLRHPSDDIDRDVKRRKVETSSNGKGNKEIEERSPEKEKRKAKVRGDERKERKMSRKRDRTEETAILEQKRRRDEQKAVIKLGGHQNGSQEEHHYEKYHKREKSPFRDRSHEEPRDKQNCSEMDKVFFSDITRSNTHKNDLKELCKVEPAAPIINDTVINLDCDFNPRYDKHYVPKKKSKVKVRTVRDIRNQFEKDVLVDLPSYLERQQNLLLRKIRDGSSRNDQTKVIAKNILNSEEPISRSSWLMLMNINPEGYTHTKQYVLYEGKPIRINGSRGGRNKFIYNLNKVEKTFKTHSLKKSFFKKKYLLRNSLSVNFKPGPLTRKYKLDNSYQRYNVGDIELVNLPKPGLEVQPSHGRSLDPMISNLITNFRDINGRISEKWAEFAVSVLDSKNTLNYSNESPLIFDLNYKCNQRRILMRRDRDSDGERKKIKLNTNNMEISVTEELDDISEIRVMMNEILNAVEISLNQDIMYASEDEPIEDSEKSTLDSNISNSSVKDKTKKRYCELDKLDVTVIRLPENEQKDLSVCKNSFCSLGCICDSLQSVVHLKSHCGRIDCMFECKCDFSKYSFISEYNGECSELLPGLINLENEINNKLAKEEQKFHQTVIVSGQQSILLKSQKRHSKLSKKYADFYSKMCSKSDLKLGPVLSLTINKFKCDNIEPWCMVHNLYKCFCKGKFLESVKTEKVSNENEKCTIIFDIESPDVGAYVGDDNDSQDKLRARLRRDKYAERNSSVFDLDKEPDMKDSGSNESNHAFKYRRRHFENVKTCTYYHSDSTCARIRPYGGRKYSLGYYLNANHNILNMEINDSNLRKRLDSLVHGSVNDQDQVDEVENNTPNQTASRRSERMQRRKEREKACENERAKDKMEETTIAAIESQLNAALEENSNAAIEVNSNPANELNLNSKVGPNSKKLMNISPDQFSSESHTESSQIEMIGSASDKRISNKPQLVAWLESSYQQYKKREEMGIVKLTLDPPKKGKVLLYPWDFILSRYSERKNLFLISKNEPFRIFMAVDSKNKLFENCINIDEIRFADLYKYPATIKNLLTSTSGLKDNFCILFGLPHCWELIGSVMKINDSIENTNKKIIENALSDQAMANISYPMEEVFDQTNAQISVPEATTSSNSRESATTLQSPDKNTVSESSKWFVMTIENDFAEIQFYNKGFFVKHESIMKAINVAKASGKTVRLSSQKCADKINSPQFGIYAIPNASENCVFVGPYETDESLGIETVKLVSQVRRQRVKTRGVWIITNKVDNLKVIDNPLSFMPSQHVQKNEMLPLDRVTKEDNNKMCNPEIQKTVETAVHSSSEVPMIVKYVKTAKPITIRKTDEICRIASSKSLLKTANKRLAQDESMTAEILSSPIISLPSELQENYPPPLISIHSEFQPGSHSVSSILLTDPSKISVQHPPVVCEQKFKKPIAEVAPQIKIAAVYSEAVGKSIECKRPQGTMLILKPEEINKRHFEKNIPMSEEPPFTNINSETMDIEDYLESSTVCSAPEDSTLIISDEEVESPIKEVGIVCTNIENLGLISARMNEEGQISFQFPGFKKSEFYPRETAFEKIQQVLSRKVYIPSNIILEWDVVESKETIENSKLLNTEDFSSDLVLTKQGLRHKTLVFKSSNDLKTYARRKAKEQADSEASSPIPNEIDADAIIKSIVGATQEDRQQYTERLVNIMQENNEEIQADYLEITSELFED